MRVLALDLSTAKSGYAAADDKVPFACGLWKTPGRKAYKEQHQKIEFMRHNVATMIDFTQPDLVVIEVCAPQRNAETFRALVRVEAICGQEAHKRNIPVVLARVAAVREIAMGSGKMGKDTVFTRLSEQYPQFPWVAQDKGGDDMSDALAMALAGEELAERR